MSGGAGRDGLEGLGGDDELYGATGDDGSYADARGGLSGGWGPTNSTGAAATTAWRAVRAPTC